MNLFDARKRIVMQLKMLVIVCYIFMNALFLSGATINVPADQPTIQAGIDAAVSGVDEVVVAPGTYHETIEINNKKVSIRSSSGNPADTIIDGGGSGTVVEYHFDPDPNTSSLLSGFTITGGSGVSGGGLRNFQVSLVVTDCIFKDNTSPAGGGILLDGSSFTHIVHCVFVNNTASVGGGISMVGSSNVSITNCLFSGNSASNQGGAIYSFGNFSNIANCTLSGNSAPSGSGVFLFEPGHLLLTNCIVWGNTGSSSQIFGSSSAVTANYSNIQGGFSGTNNINQDPLFVDADGADNTVGTLDDDLRLQVFSPSINSGDNSAIPSGITTDLEGNSRIIAAVVDMGAHEFAGPLPIHNITQSLDYNMIQLAIDEANNGDIIEVDPGTYYETIDINNKKVTIRSSSGNPADTIIDGGGSGTVVEYHFDPDPNTSSLLSGFTITGGSGVSGGGLRNFQVNLVVTDCVFKDNTSPAGGGIFLDGSSFTHIVHCVFVNNTASVGGGISMVGSSNVSITNCLFSGNSASNQGGAIYSFGNFSNIANCTLSGNSASNGSGVFIFEPGHLLLTNCIVWGNTGSSSQIFGSSSAVTANYSNIQGGFSGTNNINQDPLFVDADGADNTVGTLDDDLRLQVFSPSINSGDNAAIPSGITTDLDGNSRIIAAVVDMGAYEFLSPCSLVGDINCDGIVDSLDLSLLADNWLSTIGFVSHCILVGDINCDGMVDLLDVALMAGNWLATI